MINYIKIIFFTAFFFHISTLTAQNPAKSDSLTALIEQASSYKQKIEILNELTNMHFGDSPQKSLITAKQIIKIAEENNYTEGLATGFMQSGRAYAMMGSYREAFEAFTKAKKNYALLKDVNNEASALNSMANTLYMNENYKEALKYYRQSLIIKKQTKDTIGIGIAYGNMGECYLQMDLPVSALSFAEKGLNIERQLENTQGIAVSKSSIAYIKFSMGKYDEALSDYFEASETFVELNDLYQLSYNYLDIAQIYLLQQKHKEALPYMEKGMKYAQTVQAVNLEVQYLKLFSEYFEKTGQTKKSLDYYKQFHNLKDSLRNTEKSRQVAELQTLYELETKENEIQLLAKENTLNRTLMLSVSGILLSVLLLTFITFRQYRLKKRTAHLLEVKNKEIEAQKSEILTQNEQLELRTKQLQELDEIKSAFFANISHEFRTPLTLILGPLETLIKNRPDTSESKELKMIKRQAEKLLVLINQLLELSKIEKGEQRLKISKTEADSFFKNIFYAFRPLADEKHIHFEYENKLRKNTITADKEKLESILSNLLSNAVKFTENNGRVKLMIYEENDAIKISVSDTGIGISADEQNKIFSRFYRASNKDYVPGTGIGLALVKELTQLHGGKVHTESSPGKGSRFIIQLPQNIDIHIADNYEDTKRPIQEKDAEEISETKAKAGGRKLLIVEDNQDMQQYIKSIFDSGFEVFVSPDGSDALKKLESFEPDLIISDIMMPKTDGLSLTKQIKSNPNHNHIPIILLTAKSSQSDKITGLRQRADAYITKPFSPEELLIKVNNIIGVRELLRKKFQKNIELNPSEITASSIDEQFFEKALQTAEKHLGDSEFTVEDFCKSMGMSRANLHRKIKALTGRSTGEFIRELRLKRAAQLLKTNSGSISEIAYSVGFNNLSYFSKCFKKSFGKLPSEF